MFQYIANKMAERSTWAGLMALAASTFGWQMPELMTEPVTLIGMGVGGLILVLVNGKRVK